MNTSRFFIYSLFAVIIPVIFFLMAGNLPDLVNNSGNNSYTIAAETTAFYVSPSGKDTNDGKSIDTPFQTIQKAIDIAQAGQTITLAEGIYLQDIISRRDGKQDAPILITGPPGAIVKGGGENRIIEINHSYITLKDFSIDGQFGDGDEVSGYRDKLVYVLGKGKKAGVKGLKILNMNIRNAGGECIRLRYFAKENEIAGNRIYNCGIFDFRFDGEGKNGEGIYIGTAPEQRKDGKNPTTDPDESNNNLIHDNIIDTQGNECVDIKESATGNVVENNKCTGQKDPDSGGMDSRGDRNTFRNNEIINNKGTGIRLGGDGLLDGVGNHIYNNTISNNDKGGIKIQRFPQGSICGNQMSQNGKDTTGTFRVFFNPASTCKV